MNRQSQQLEKLFGDVRRLILCGAYWGDEGKGAVVDAILSFFELVARYSGGNNAGHTVYTDEGEKLVSHLIPSGLARRKPCVIGSGVFVNLQGFLDEIDEALEVLGSDLPGIFIDRNCPLYTSDHGLFEAYLEWSRGSQSIKTTKNGIGPLAGLDALRQGLRVGDLFATPDSVKPKLYALRVALEPCFVKLGSCARVSVNNLPKPPDEAKRLLELADRVREFATITDTSALLRSHWLAGNPMLFEGSQALGLDLRRGTYPFVTSGSATVHGAPEGTGLPPWAFDASMLVAKVFPTRVGAGPFPSEIWTRESAENFPKQRPKLFEDGEERTLFLQETLDAINSGSASDAEISQYLQVLGDERGATTGRGRSVGWMDLPWLRYAIEINNPRWLALTRFDMLSGLRSTKVVTGYRIDGESVSPGAMPYMGQFGQVDAETAEWDCWEEDIRGCHREEDLPESAQEFLRQLEQALGIPIPIVKTGPERGSIIIREEAVAVAAA